MKVLGYNGGLYGYPAAFGQSHDAAAALVIDGELVAACEEERFNREKHSGKFPRTAMEFCLKQGGIKDLSEIDMVAFYFSYKQMFNAAILADNRRGMNPVVRAGLWAFLRGARLYNKVIDLDDIHNRTLFEREMGVRLGPSQFRSVPHHVCHVASAFYASPFERALAYSIDGMGESTCGLAMVMDGTKGKRVREVYIPNEASGLARSSPRTSGSSATASTRSTWGSRRTEIRSRIGRTFSRCCTRKRTASIAWSRN